MTDKYDVDAKKQVKELFSLSNLEIPYNQRHYEWEDKNIDEFFNDLYDHYKTYVDEGISFYSLGSFMYTVEKQTNKSDRYSLWDGQQRTLTSYLLLAAIYHKTDKNDHINMEIKEYIFKKIYDWSEDEKDKYNKLKIIPLSVKCVYKNDNDTLLYLINNKMRAIEDFCENDGYKCNECDKKYKNNKQLYEHIIEEHIKSKIVREIYESHYINKICNKIIHAFEKIKILIEEKFGDDSEDDERYTLVGMARYFLDNVLFDRWKYYDINVASEKFDLLNSRGKKLEISDIIRNMLIRNIPANEQKKYYDKLEELVKNTKKLQLSKEYINVFKLLCELVNGNIEYSHSDNIIETFQKILECDNDDEKSTVEKKYELLEKHYNFVKEIKDKLDKKAIGKSILQEINWDMFKYIIVPSYIKYEKSTKNIDRILELLATYQNITIFTPKNQTFVQKQSKMFFEIKNKIMEPEKTNINDFLTFMCTKFNIGQHQIDLFMDNLKIKTLKNQRAKQLLYYYVAMTQAKCIMNENYDVEHVLSKKEGGTNTYVDFFGNLTLLEGLNSNEHNGNRSLGAKCFSDKKKSYEKSNIEMTRKLCKYKKWDVDKINDETELRSNELIKIFKKTLIKKSNSDSDEKKPVKVKSIKTTKKAKTIIVDNSDESESEKSDVSESESDSDSEKSSDDEQNSDSEDENECIFINNDNIDLKKYNFQKSQIISCDINGKKVKKLKYKSILFDVYHIIDNNVKIIKNKINKINIKIGEHNDKGYDYIEDLEISVQDVEAKTSLEEILNQCICNKIKINFEIKLKNDNYVRIKIK
jgi:hypothetical protein